MITSFNKMRYNDSARLTRNNGPTKTTMHTLVANCVPNRVSFVVNIDRSTANADPSNQSACSKILLGVLF